MSMCFFIFPTIYLLCDEKYAKLTLTTCSDYASVVLVVMLILGVGNWFAYAKRHYHGPRLDI